jgi:Phosphotransferase enzyme family
VRRARARAGERDRFPGLAGGRRLARTSARTLRTSARPTASVRFPVAPQRQLFRPLSPTRSSRGVRPVMCARPRLANVLDNHDATVTVLAREPETLVHGSYRPQNVLVARSSSPARICPTDWELAAFGRSAYDLAFLCDGFPPAQFNALRESYERAVEHHGLTLPDGDDLRREVNCFRLHKTISSLGHSHQWKRPAETAANVLAAAEEIARTLS